MVGSGFCGAFNMLTIHTAQRKPIKNLQYQVVTVWVINKHLQHLMACRCNAIILIRSAGAERHLKYAGQ